MPDTPTVRADTERWLARAVIGLNLCPFAKAVQAKGRVHIVVSEAQDDEALLEAFARELDDLVARGEDDRETTLLVAPHGLAEFLAFNDFAGRAERLLRRRGLEGVIQLATFHPAYQFAGTDAGDVTNCTNRSPYPTLHLLRESSIDRAVQAFPDAAAIYDTNMETLRRIGPEGWSALGVGASR
jgi:hypothetical protein